MIFSLLTDGTGTNYKHFTKKWRNPKENDYTYSCCMLMLFD